MQNKAILITGCSSGIGLCVAHGLRERGYRVFASARKHTDVARLAAEGFAGLQLDLANSSSIHAAVNGVLEQTGGRLYALFNNGAYGQPGAVEDLSRECLREQFEVNLFGTLELTNRVIPGMREQGYGRIIQNSSLLGFVALPYRGAYNASKFALEGMTRTLRLELRGTDIHAVLIEPGPIASSFRANAYAAFLRHINPNASAHSKAYHKLLERLAAKSPAVRFTLPPDAVLARVIQALESRRPRPHYYVTFPSYLFAALKHILPYRLLESMLARI